MCFLAILHFKKHQNWFHIKSEWKLWKFTIAHLGKYFMKATFFTKEVKVNKELISRNIFWVRVNFSFLHSVEISGIFYCHHDFTWNQFWPIWSPKKCHFDRFSDFEFRFWVNSSPLKMAQIHHNQNSELSKLQKWHFLIF